MIQRCIELGEGYADIYELLELARSMPERVTFYVALHTKKNGREVTSLALIMKKGFYGSFEPVYICLEGISASASSSNKRYELFEQTARENNQTVRELFVKPSSSFHDKTLYYQYLIGIFQMNRLVKIH